MVVVWRLAVRPARGGTRVLLAAECLTVALIVVVIAVVFGKLAAHTAPHGLGVDWSVLTLPSGTPLSAVFLGVVFGFLSFAGFEAASALGEETRRPTRNIPRAVLGVAVFGGIYFMVVTAVEVMGFGTSAKGVTAFTASPSLIGDLGTAYIASWLGTIITAGAMISAFGSALACLVGASRIVYALGRDHVLPVGLGRLSRRRHTPAVAAAAVMVTVYAIIAFTWFILRGDPFTLFLQAATAGTLIVLVVYLLATIGMTRLVFFSGQATVRRWQIAVPVLALIVLGYTLFRNVWPLPSGVAWWGPSAAAAWLVAGIAGVLARPAATRRAGALLASAEGLTMAAPAPSGQPAAEAQVPS
jgi:amino acid transporter